MFVKSLFFGYVAATLDAKQAVPAEPFSAGTVSAEHVSAKTVEGTLPASGYADGLL